MTKFILINNEDSRYFILKLYARVNIFKSINHIKYISKWRNCEKILENLQNSATEQCNMNRNE